jgi:stress response protein YsnF
MASNDENDYNHLEELGGSKYKIVDGQSNIKGWDVKDASGRYFGEVDELIFNPATRKVRYMVVDLGDNDFDIDPRKVLIPIGVATLHENDDDVILSDVNAGHLERLPKYEEGKITPATESTIRNLFAGTESSGDYKQHDEDFYEHDHFDEDRFFGNRRSKKIPVIEEDVQIGKREEETGGARITSKIEERPVEENMRLREEHINVNRTPTDRPVSDKDLDTFQEGEMEIPAHKEVPVVNKEARVVEEVNINKTVTEDEKTIKDTVKKTDVEAERIDPNDPNRKRDK